LWNQHIHTHLHGFGSLTYRVGGTIRKFYKNIFSSNKFSLQCFHCLTRCNVISVVNKSTVSRQVNIHTQNLSVPGNRNVRHLLYTNKCVNTNNCTVIYQQARLVCSQETRVGTQTNTMSSFRSAQKETLEGKISSMLTQNTDFVQMTGLSC